MNSKHILKTLAMVFTLTAMIAFVSCDSSEEEEPEPDPTETLYQLIESTDNLDSLKKYLDFYPDLVATLSGEGDFTLFAPDNNAFVGLLATPGFPEDIRSINPEIIKGVLTYHVLGSRLEAEDIVPGASITTLVPGESIVVNDDGTLLTGSSNPNIVISQADIKATNGVMHVIASVMITPTVGETLTPILGTNAGTLLLGANFSILANAIQTKAEAYAATSDQIGSLVAVLSGETTHTVFAPTNETFYSAAGVAEGDDQATIDAKVAGFLEAFTPEQWYGIIANHVVLSQVTPDQLTTGATFATALPGSQLLVFNNTELVPADNGLGIYLDSNGDVDLQDPTTLANLDAEVVAPASAVGTVAANGRVHIIAGVLLPPTGESGN